MSTSAIAALVFGLLAAVVSVAQIIKYLYDIVHGIGEIKHTANMADVQVQADLQILKSMLLSSREDLTRQLAEVEERVEKLENFISRYLTLRK